MIFVQIDHFEMSIAERETVFNYKDDEISLKGDSS